MSCEEFADSVSDYLDGRVPYGKQIGMWLHGMMCAPCRRYLDQMREVVEMMGEVGEREQEDGVSGEVKEDLMSQFRSKYEE